MEQLTLRSLRGIGLRVYRKHTISQDTEAKMQNLRCKVKIFECINALCLLKQTTSDETASHSFNKITLLS